MPLLFETNARNSRQQKSAPHLWKALHNLMSNIPLNHESELTTKGSAMYDRSEPCGYPLIRLGPPRGCQRDPRGRGEGGRLRGWFSDSLYHLTTLTHLLDWLPQHAPNRKIEFRKHVCVNQGKTHPLIICDVFFVMRFQVNWLFF